MDDLYRILGIKKDADLATIKKAYKKLARQYHPDRNKAADAAERFQKIKHAYDVLSDPEDRRMYDQYGAGSLGGDGRSWDDSGVGDFESFFRNFTGESASNYQDRQYTWEGRKGTQRARPQNPYSEQQNQYSGYQSNYNTQDFGFGHRRRSQGDFEPPEKGMDIRVEVKISLLEAIQGCEKKIKLRRPSKWKQDASLLNEELIRVEIPPNTMSNTEIKIPNKGNYGKGGGADGRLLVNVLVTPSQNLFREGYDLFLIVPITLSEALHGAQIQVPTLGKSIKIKLPKGIKMGQKLRVKGKGAPKSNGFGDLYLILYPTLPISKDLGLERVAESLEHFYPQEGIRHNLKID